MLDIKARACALDVIDVLKDRRRLLQGVVDGSPILRSALAIEIQPIIQKAMEEAIADEVLRRRNFSDGGRV